MANEIHGHRILCPYCKKELFYMMNIIECHHCKKKFRCEVTSIYSTYKDCDLNKLKHKWDKTHICKKCGKQEPT